MNAAEPPIPDPDLALENEEWRDALLAVVEHAGRERAHELLDLL